MRIRQPDFAVDGAVVRFGTVEELAELMAGRRSVVLTGAGISTESGIPDYRGVDRVGPVRTPLSYQEFVGDALKRRRYWARSMVGWPAMRDRAPNGGHVAVAELEAAGLVSGVITQNVDGLHQKAGSRNVVELHGTLSRAVCLSCGRPEDRGDLQERMAALNPRLLGADVTVLPDGDAEIPEELVESFEVPACRFCGGVLKADVTFFGEGVPRDRVRRATEMVAGAGALVVLGSSLAVRSGYRFVAAAKAAGEPVAIVNHGPTRGDADATVRVDARLGQALAELTERLLG